MWRPYSRHVHFHSVVVDEVFEASADEPMRFHADQGLGSEARADLLAMVRGRLLRALAQRGPLELADVQAMGAREYGGDFSLEATVRLEGDDREGLKRLLRNCARPASALNRLREINPEHLFYESVKPGLGGSVRLIFTPLGLHVRLHPPPRSQSRKLMPDWPMDSMGLPAATTPAWIWMQP